MSEKVKHVGLWADRLKYDNPREAAFASEWQRENDIERRTAILDQLLYSHGHGLAFACDASCAALRAKVMDTTNVEEHRAVAATVIQWLGSNVGFSFLEESLRKCGYEIVRKSR